MLSRGSMELRKVVRTHSGRSSLQVYQCRVGHRQCPRNCFSSPGVTARERVGFYGKKSETNVNNNRQRFLSRWITSVHTYDSTNRVLV